MAKPLVLSLNEKFLYDELSAGIRGLQDSRYSEQEAILKELAPKARELHMSLKAHGHEPVYHGFILKNREISPEETVFFIHIHPIEDLLAFIRNPESNNELAFLPDRIGYSFPVFVRKRRRTVNYRIVCTETCWRVNDGDDRDGLMEILSNEDVSYPITVEAMLENIRGAAEGGITKKDIQDALLKIAEWISACEKSRPAIEKIIG